MLRGNIMGVINYISLAINGNSNPWDYLGMGNVLDADDSGLKVWRQTGIHCVLL